MEMARTMLNKSKLSNILWLQDVHIVVHIMNRSLLRNNYDKTPYQLWKGRPASVKHFRIFGSKCYINKVDKNMGKLDSRTDEGILVGYSCSRIAYKCYNFRLKKVVEAIDVKFDESSFFKSKIEQKDHQTYEIYDKLKMEEESSDIEETKSTNNENMIPTLLQGSTPSKTPNKKVQRNHHEDKIIGDIMQVLKLEEKGKNLFQITNKYHSYLCLNPRMLKNQLMMNIG